MTLSQETEQTRENPNIRRLPLVARFVAEVGPQTTVLSEGKGVGRGGSRSGAIFSSLRRLLAIEQSAPLPDVFKFVSTRGRMLRDDYFQSLAYEASFDQVEAQLGKEVWYKRLGVQQVAATALNNSQYRVSVFLDREGQRQADEIFKLLDDVPLSIDTRTPQPDQRHHFVFDLPIDLINPEVLDQGVRHTAVKDLMRQHRGESAVALGVGLSVARGYEYRARRKS